MGGIGPRLPLEVDGADGAYGLIKSYKEEIRQNLINLIMTAPGERIMIPNFGVGLRNYLFEQRPSFDNLAAKIEEQVDIYMPFIDIEDIDIQLAETEAIINNAVFITISYNIVPLDQDDTLVIEEILKPSTI